MKCQTNIYIHNIAQYLVGSMEKGPSHLTEALLKVNKVMICSFNHPFPSTKISNYKKWIELTLLECLENPPEINCCGKITLFLLTLNAGGFYLVEFRTLAKNV